MKRVIGGAGVRPLNTIVVSPIANNGGPTPTFKLTTASPALNAGASVAGLPTTDQRGLARVAFGVVDIGAYEENMLPDVTSPTVTGVYFAGSTWWSGTGSFREAAGNATFGYPDESRDHHSECTNKTIAGKSYLFL